MARSGQLNDVEAAAKRVSAKLEEGNIKGALQLLSSVDSVAPCTRVIYDSLKALHPSSPPDCRPPPVPSGDPLRVMSSEVRYAIRSFPNGSAGGPDGLRPQHLKDLLAAGDTPDGSDPLLEAITDLINMLLEGRVPSNIGPILFGAALTGIIKKERRCPSDCRWLCVA